MTESFMDEFSRRPVCADPDPEDELPPIDPDWVPGVRNIGRLLRV